MDNLQSSQLNELLSADSLRGNSPCWFVTCKLKNKLSAFCQRLLKGGWLSVFFYLLLYAP